MVRLKSEDYRWCCPPGEPGAFDCSCDNCEMVSGTFVTSEPGTGFTCLVCGEEVEGRALWGIEWAAVAWMAAAEVAGMGDYYPEVMERTRFQERVYDELGCEP